MAPTADVREDETRKSVVFDASKKQVLSGSAGFKLFSKKLKSSWKVSINKETLTKELLQSVKLFIIPFPNSPYSAAECEVLREYLDGGGCVMLMGVAESSCDVKNFVNQYGVFINQDAVLRSHYYKYFHPREALISNGIVNRVPLTVLSSFHIISVKSDATAKWIPVALSQASGKWSGYMNEDNRYSQAISFVYPHGCTLNVSKPSVVLLSSGGACYPLNRPIASFCSERGRLLIVGSQHMFSDAYIDKEDNNKLLEVLLQLLLSNDITLNQIDAENPEISDYNLLPDTGSLSEQPKCCLQESEETPRNAASLFNASIFTLDTSLVPDVIKTYEHLNVPHDSLSLITPQFETPLPALHPAVFSPSFRDLPPPSLQLFDLDDQFTSEKVKLAQITNKCKEEDLEYYIKECAHVFGLNQVLPLEKFSGKNILKHVFNAIVDFKKI